MRLRAFLALGGVLHHLPYCTILPIHWLGRRRRGNPAPFTKCPWCSLLSTCGPRACFHTHNHSSSPAVPPTAA
eukprot:2916800-Rhodomonas_salina.1